MATNAPSTITTTADSRVAPTLETAPIDSYMTSDTSIRLPKDINELKTILTSDHKASKLVGSSLKAHRSPYESMIFLYGLTGAGKSSTLNHLFNYELIPTSDRSSCTRSVIEYVATMDSPHWDVTGLNLGFVDTPGYGDSENEDTNNIANIEQFLSTHPLLKSDMAPFNFYPNIVLIVANITDNRMGGERSNFSKMLRILSNLKIVDRARPNVVIVLTHAMFIRPKASYNELLKRKTDYVSNLARLYFEINIPIVVMDNLTEDLVTEGDWTILPDYSRQPLNLFKAMVSLMMQSGDEIGIESIRLLFNDRRQFRISEKRIFGSDQGLFKDIVIRPDIPKWEKMKCEIPKLFDSQIKNKIISCIKENQIPRLTLTEETILPLLNRLQQVHIFNFSDLSDKNIEEVNRQLLPFKLNKQERILFFDLFQVIPLQSLDNLDRLGCGYLLSERILKFPIVSGNEMKFCSEIGVQIPVFSHFDFKGRLLVHCQFEWVHPSMLAPKKPTIFFTVQYELFNLSIDVDNSALENAFDKIVNSLPKFETDPDKATMKAYKSFFNKYGTHCLLSLSYGGCISGNIDLSFITTKISDDVKLRETHRAYTLLWIFFETSQNYNQLASDYKSIIDPNSYKLFDEIMKTSITCSGGDETFSNSKIEDINPTLWSRWVDSLNRKFVSLENLLYTISIVTFLKEMKFRDNDKVKSIGRAIKEQHRTDKPSTSDDKFLPVFECVEPRVWDPEDSREMSGKNQFQSREETSDSAKSTVDCMII